MMTRQTPGNNQGIPSTSRLWMPLPDCQQELLSGGAPRWNGGNGGNSGGGTVGGTTGGRPGNGNRPPTPVRGTTSRPGFPAI